MPKQIPVEIDGKKYAKITAAAKAYHIAPYMVYRRLKRGWTMEQALKIPWNVSKLNGFFVDGVEYPTFLAIAKAYNIKVETLRYRISQGWTIEDAAKTPPKGAIPISVYGISYSCIRDVAKYFGIDSRRISDKLKKGWNIEDIIEYEQNKTKRILKIPVTIDGVTYPSIRKAADAIGVNYHLVRGRILQGWSVEDAFAKNVQKMKTPIAVDNTKYVSVRKAALENNINIGTVRMRLKLGWSNDDALLAELNEHEKPVEVDGTKYPSIYSAADAYDVSVSMVYSRLRAGWSIEAALKTPPTKIVERNGREIEIRVKGVSYRSISEVARAYDLRIGTVMWRLKHGWTPEEAVGIAERKRPKRK